MKPVRPRFPSFVACATTVLVLVLAGPGRAAETIPPAPARHFNDYAAVVRPATAQELDARLAAFERETSTQIVVALYPRMQSDSSVEDYTVRVAQAWGVGVKGRNNGAVLFAFMEQRQLYLQVGYGLEGALPDALAKRIIEDEIIPRFRAGDRDAGLRAGVEAILAATKGEYRGTGRAVGDAPGNRGEGGGGFVFFLVLVVVTIAALKSRAGGQLYTPRGRRSLWTSHGPWIGGGHHGGGGFGGGGGFSGGGGGFGGGGAGGRW